MPWSIPSCDSPICANGAGKWQRVRLWRDHREGAMTFLWPEMLWLVLIVPALVAGYFYILRRKQESAVKYASLTMVKQAIGPRQRLRRHIPPLLFLIALIAMIVAIARPAAIVMLPSQYQTIILAMEIGRASCRERV